MSAAPGGTQAPAARAAGSLRLFFALQPDPAARQALGALARDIARETGGRATPAENLHVTLVFLGRVPPSHVAQVEAAGARAAAVGEPFALALDQVGWFRRAGVAWAGPRAVPPALQHIFGALCGALEEAGFVLEARPFDPHLTLARRSVRPPAERNAFRAQWSADAIVLMASETLPAGPVYRALASWRLGEHAGPPPSE